MSRHIPRASTSLGLTLNQGPTGGPTPPKSASTVVARLRSGRVQRTHIATPSRCTPFCESVCLDIPLKIWHLPLPACPTVAPQTGPDLPLSPQPRLRRPRPPSTSTIQSSEGHPRPGAWRGGVVRDCGFLRRPGSACLESASRGHAWSPPLIDRALCPCGPGPGGRIDGSGPEAKKTKLLL